MEEEARPSRPIEPPPSLDPEAARFIEALARAAVRRKRRNEQSRTAKDIKPLITNGYLDRCGVQHQAMSGRLSLVR